jgi:hypothetical protein
MRQRQIEFPFYRKSERGRRSAFRGSASAGYNALDGLRNIGRRISAGGEPSWFGQRPPAIQRDQSSGRLIEAKRGLVVRRQRERLRAPRGFVLQKTRVKWDRSQFSRPARVAAEIPQLNFHAASALGRIRFPSVRPRTLTATTPTAPSVNHCQWKAIMRF